MSKRILLAGSFLVLVLAFFTVTICYAGNYLNIDFDNASADENNLVTYYDFKMQNEGSTIIPDASENSHAGELKGLDADQKHLITNPSIFGTTKKACKVYGGANGTYLEIPKDTFTSMVTTNQMTASAWVNLDENLSYGRIFDFGTGTSNYLYVLDSGQNRGFTGLASAVKIDGGSENGVEKGEPLTIGAWTLVTVTVDTEGTLTLYQNGQKIDSSETYGNETVKTLAQAIIDQEGTSSHCYVARSNYSDPTLNGSFTDIKIYDKALSAEEVKAQFGATAQQIAQADADILKLSEITDLKVDFYVPAKGVYGSDITWASNNAAISFDAEPIEIEDESFYVAHVNRPASTASIASVKLTGTCKYTQGSDTGTASKDFIATVSPMEPDEQLVLDDINAAMTKYAGVITEETVLASTGENGTKFVWTCDSENVKLTLVEDGYAVTIIRPSYGSDDISTNLHIVGALNSASRSGTIPTTVKAVDQSKLVVDHDLVNVVCKSGEAPQLPNYIGVTYKNGTTGNAKVKWDVESSYHVWTVSGTVAGSLVGVQTESESIVSVVANIALLLPEENATKLADTFDLDDIDLTGDNFLVSNCKQDIDCLVLMGKSVKDDTKGRTVMRMLYNFYVTYGVYTETDLNNMGIYALGGWDEPTGLLRGHSTGHYISALALAYSSSDYRKDEIKTILENMMSEMVYLQGLCNTSGKTAADFTPKYYDDTDHYGKNSGFRETYLVPAMKVANWSTDPNAWGKGFISAYSPDQFVLLEMGAPYGSPDSGIWAPYYTYHKLLSGFLDTYDSLPEGMAKQNALTLAKEAGEWASTRVNKVMNDSQGGQAQLTKMWDTYIAGEYGGMNEVLAHLYNIATESSETTLADLYKSGSQCFDNKTLFNKLADNIDGIKTLHANQHIPQIIGAIAEYEAGFVPSDETDTEYYYKVAKNFWYYVTGRYAYSIGGVGKDEKFTLPYTQAASIFNDRNCETCCAYNMLKLTRELMKYEPDNSDYMDYYERTLYNQITASQNPNVTAYEHNGTTYMLPIGPGQTRGYGSDWDDFTCCHGTGMENHVKYQEAAYYKSMDGTTLYVGLYLPTSLDWSSNLKVVQTTSFPSEDSKITFSGSGTAPSTIKLRVPYWCKDGFTVKKNGTVVNANNIGGYVTLSGISSTDVIEVHMPYSFHLDYTPDQLDGSDVASIMYGPWVMCAQNSSREFLQMNFMADVNQSITKTGVDDRGLPIATTNGQTLYAMPSKVLATSPYHAYYKVFVDDGTPWALLGKGAIDKINPHPGPMPDPTPYDETDFDSTAAATSDLLPILLIILVALGAIVPIIGYNFARRERG